MSSKNVIDLRKPMRQASQGGRSAPMNAPRLPLQERKSKLTLRERRRRIRALFALLILIVIGTGVWEISYLSYMPRFNVSSVQVAGTQSVPARLVQAYAETQIYDGAHPYLSRDNVLMFNADALAKAIESYFPKIASAHVSRSSMFATAAEITVTERQPYALWSDGDGNYYEMDQTGFIFASASAEASSDEQASSTPVRVPSTPSGFVFTGGISTSSNPIGQSFIPAHLPGIEAFLQILSQSGYAPQGASVQNDEDFFVPLGSGYYLKASFGENPQTLLQNLQLVLSSDALQGDQQNLEYVDLRFGDKIYYKLQGQPESGASQ